MLCDSMDNYVLHRALTNWVPPAELQPQLCLDAVSKCPEHVRTLDATKAFFAGTKSIIFVAPDIGRPDMENMLHELHAAEGAQGWQLVLYCSKQDRPLMTPRCCKCCIAFAFAEEHVQPGQCQVVVCGLAHSAAGKRKACQPVITGDDRHL